MNEIKYQAIFEPQAEGGYTITFPDIPEAISEADTLDAAFFNAADVLSLSLEVRLSENAALPEPKKHASGKWILPNALVQAAACIRHVREEQGKTLSDMARILNTSWAATQRLENPHHTPTLKQLERAAAALGKRLTLSLQ